MHKNNEVIEFYEHDVVYRFDKRQRIVFGMVTDSCSPLNSRDTDLEKGQIRVAWLNNHLDLDQVHRQEKVHLKSRNIRAGEIVRRFEQGKETQRGYCQSFKQLVAVQIVGTDKVISHVSHERLMDINMYDFGTAVCLDDKVGRVVNYELQITMQSKCGSIVQIMSNLNNEIIFDWPSNDKKQFSDEYYVGQALAVVPANLDMPYWVKKTKAMKRSLHLKQRFIIQKVELVHVVVDWQNFGGDDPSIITTEQSIVGKDIARLSALVAIEDGCLPLDRRILKLNSTDLLMRKREWLAKESLQHGSGKVLSKSKNGHMHRTYGNSSVIMSSISRNLRNLAMDQQVPSTDDEDGWLTDVETESEKLPETPTTPSNGSMSRKKKRPTSLRSKGLIPGRIVPIEVLCSESKVTVVWQDGTIEKNIPSTQLYYSMSLDDHEFFPGEWVYPASANDHDREYGVVQKVNYLDRTVSVKWFTYSKEDSKPVYTKMEELSVYDMMKHPSYTFRPGCLVYKEKPQENNLGTVVDSCPEGYVLVQWITGNTEECWPQDICVLPENLDYLNESDDEDNADVSLQLSWETESMESLLGDLTYETNMQHLASRVEFIRNRIVYLKEAFKQHTFEENFSCLRDLLIVYDNSSYLDRLLGTSFFSVKSKHYQVLLLEIKERAQKYGVEIRTKLFSNLDGQSLSKLKVAEKENINKVIKLENKINAEMAEPSSSKAEAETEHNQHLCIELLSMLKSRMDLTYAEIISRIGHSQALTAMTDATEAVASPLSASKIPHILITSPESAEQAESKVQNLELPTKVLFVADSSDNKMEKTDKYCIHLDEAPACHRFFKTKVEPVDKKRFFKALTNEIKLFRECLPSGVWIYSYGDRMDLLSVMIRGPNKTPYEDGLFLFDIQFSPDYPRSPPTVSYISYNSERINPNLYVEGRVCVSLLGTWLGKGTEMWGSNSTLLQLIVSIQGLILVAEPYYNEAGYEKQCSSQQGLENSRIYNELVILRLVQSMTKLLMNPHEIFKDLIRDHFMENGEKMCSRLKSWINETYETKPEFPLLPVSKGLKLSLNIALDEFGKLLDRNRQIRTEELQKMEVDST